MNKLIEKAKTISKTKEISKSVTVGQVGAVLVTDKGTVFKGVSISTACNLGHCAEVSAISAMLTAGESRIAKIVSTGSDGTIFPPCGRCRELMFQINEKNLKTEVIVAKDKTLKLEELLPARWQDFCLPAVRQGV